jgi:hypothetical protein
MPTDNARKENPKIYATGEEGLGPARNTLLYESRDIFKKSTNCTAIQLSSPNDTINIYAVNGIAVLHGSDAKIFILQTHLK